MKLDYFLWAPHELWVDGRNPAPVEVGRWKPLFKGVGNSFVHLRWCRISSINSMSWVLLCIPHVCRLIDLNSNTVIPRPGSNVSQPLPPQCPNKNVCILHALSFAGHKPNRQKNGHVRHHTLLELVYWWDSQWWSNVFLQIESVVYVWCSPHLHMSVVPCNKQNIEICESYWPYMTKSTAWFSSPKTICPSPEPWKCGMSFLPLGAKQFAILPIGIPERIVFWNEEEKTTVMTPVSLRGSKTKKTFNHGISGWWLNQPIWKIWVKLEIFPK